MATYLSTDIDKLVEAYKSVRSIDTYDWEYEDEYLRRAKAAKVKDNALKGIEKAILALIPDDLILARIDEDTAKRTERGGSAKAFSLGPRFLFDHTEIGFMATGALWHARIKPLVDSGKIELVPTVRPRGGDGGPGYRVAKGVTYS
jgi:hypothetical protein